MNARSLFVLIFAIVVLGLTAFLLSRPQFTGGAVGELMLPGLGDTINDIDRISVTGPGSTTIATLGRTDGGWTVAEASGYPADVGRIRQNLIALAEATIVETKTANPEYYDRLGVEDLDSAQAGGMGLALSGGGYSADLIIGQTDIGGDMAYMRRTSEAQSYLARAGLDIGKNRRDWLDRRLLDIPASRIRQARIEHPDGEVLVIAKSSETATDFTVEGIPEGRKLTFPGAGNSIGAALAALELEDVIAADSFDPGTTPPVAVRFETFDGLSIDVQGWRVEDDYRFRFVAQDGDEAGAINAVTSGWIYTLPDYKADQLIRRLSDLLAAED